MRDRNANGASGKAVRYNTYQAPGIKSAHFSQRAAGRRDGRVIVDRRQL
jgi:hypothetical protein